jgi:hypothetical protein
MEFQMSSTFTQTSVDSLATMKQLKYMYIKVDEGPYINDEATMLVHIAGRVPNLVKVDFDFNKGESWRFVELYGQVYPDKDLLICQLR